MSEKRTPIDLSQFDGHTPGPWDRVSATSGFEIRIECGQQHDMAGRADMELIAAAPELLAECKRLRAKLEDKS